MHHSNMLMIRTGKNVLLRHSEDRPFATAVRQEKTYTANRGTVKTAVREAERIPLTDVTYKGKDVVLSGGGHSLRITMEKVPLGMDLSLVGEDGWLPADQATDGIHFKAGKYREWAEFLRTHFETDERSELMSE